jgi:AcrR family transcriptional regulator
VPRTVPSERFAQLIEVATKTFVARGYRLTQMSDVAEALGVSKGTLYGSVESKEALFDGAVRFADGHEALPAPGALPLRTPAPGSTVRYVQERLLQGARDQELVVALGRPEGSAASEDEFERIVRDLYRLMAKNRRALKLVDRCALDHPDLAPVWFEQGRYAQVSLIAAYLKRGIREGSLRPTPHLDLSARMVLETIALWAIHMPWDPSPRPFPEAAIEQAVVDLLVQAHTKERAP